ncbi:hypothetical protein FRX31_027001 [Thalictrum thalictroides]|uniref:Uncharacterized protein n=1 Tax=Thalictrum thalictroides TaxID=46969 RepID=A0A7J6VFG1_THATH|nr:hypothetical protein FRX31_027001 [Thalictrum thalictroides]
MQWICYTGKGHHYNHHKKTQILHSIKKLFRLQEYLSTSVSSLVSLKVLSFFLTELYVEFVTMHMIKVLVLYQLLAYC